MRPSPPSCPSVSASPSPPAAPAWDGDAAGLICAYAFAPAGAAPARELTLEQAQAWIEQHAPQATPARGFVWLHFNLSHAPCQAWLQRHAQLPDSFHEALRETLPSTRVERADDALMAIVNDVHFDFDFEPSDISTLWIAVRPHLVVTARTRPLRSVDALRTAVRAGDAPRSSIELFEHLMHTQAEVLVGIVRSVTARIDSVEDALLTNRPDQQRAQLGGLRRVLVRLQRLLAPEPAALFRLLHKPPAWISETDAQGLRDASEEFSVVLRDMGGLQERIKLLQEEIAARVQEDNNRSLFVLTVVTVLALPINILAGLFGMNVGGIPLAEDGNGFWSVVAIVATFTVVAAWIAFRKK